MQFSQLKILQPAIIWQNTSCREPGNGVADQDLLEASLFIERDDCPMVPFFVLLRLPGSLPNLA
jgi:hypothetical protein